MDQSPPTLECSALPRLRAGTCSFVVLCGFCLFVGAIAAAFLWPHHGALLDWDEVDYVSAANLGLVANAVERGALSSSEFIRLGMSKLSGVEPALPYGYVESEDPFLLRHFHPPFVVYLLAMVSPSSEERLLRSVQLLGALALVCAIIFGYRSIDNDGGWGGLLLVSFLALWMSQGFFGSISFHGWEAVWITMTAAFLSQWLGGQRNARSSVPLCASLALAFLTLEVGFLVWIGTILCMLIWRSPVPYYNERAAFPWRQVCFGAALTMLFVIVAWPGVLIKVSFLKAVAMYLYRIRLGDEYGGVSGHVPELLRPLLPMLILGPLASVWLFLVHRAGIRRWGPFVVLAGVYGIGMARFALRPQYILPALAPLICLVGVAYGRMSHRWERVLVVAASLVLALSLWPSRASTASDQEARQDLSWLATNLRGRELLVDGGHIYRYYLGSDYVIKPITASPRALALREAGKYRVAERKDVLGKVVIVQKGRPGFSDGSAQARLLTGCLRIDRFTVTVYDCASISAS